MNSFEDINYAIKLIECDQLINAIIQNEQMGLILHSNSQLIDLSVFCLRKPSTFEPLNRLIKACVKNVSIVEPWQRQLIGKAQSFRQIMWVFVANYDVPWIHANQFDQLSVDDKERYSIYHTIQQRLAIQ